MREFKIDRPVRVAWLDEPRRRDVSAEDLPAGTELDREPLILLDLDSRMPGMAKVRVNGREGLVGLRELRAALSEWRPT